jgi:hypothetical protein
VFSKGYLKQGFYLAPQPSGFGDFSGEFLPPI